MVERVHIKYGPEAMDVTDAVLQSAGWVVFEQAENRMRTGEAVLVATPGD